MTLCIASSWKNLYYPAVVEEFCQAGFQVLDWMNPRPGEKGFSWSAVDPDWREWGTEERQQGLQRPNALRVFRG